MDLKALFMTCITYYTKWKNPHYANVEKNIYLLLFSLFIYMPVSILSFRVNGKLEENWVSTN